MKHLIINADDFGYSKIFNEKILELLLNEKITSTTVMVNWITDGQQDQLRRLQELEKNKNISIGLHLEFENKNYLQQMDEQLEKFEAIFEKKPDHFDLHKSALFPDAWPIITEYSFKKGFACRNWGQLIGDTKSTNEEVLFATIGLVSVNNFGDIENWLKTLNDDKYYEICFHPGTYDPNSKSALNKDREKDVENILKLNDILANYDVQKASFRDLI